LDSFSRKPVSEGFLESEFAPAKSTLSSSPKRLLVIGSEAPGKGFTDFIEALQLFENKRPDFPGWNCELTGIRTDAIALLLAKPMRSQLNFLGRVNGFSDLIRAHDFVIHPSRSESFGMAPVEALIAGTPTLISLTGIASELSLPEPWSFPPGDIAALAKRLEFLWERLAAVKFADDSI